MRITLKQMKIFVEAAKHKTISVAAYNTFVTQPSASRAVKQLEDTLGYTLFTKRKAGKRELYLTEKGQELYKKAIDLLEQVEYFESEDLENLNPRNIFGEITIGATITIADYILSKAIAGFQEQYPNIKVKLIKGTAEEVAIKVKSSVCDAGFIDNDISDNSLVCEFWRNDEVVIIASVNNPIFKKEEIVKEDLKGVDWVSWKVGTVGDRNISLDKGQDISINASSSIKYKDSEKTRMFERVYFGEGVEIKLDEKLLMRKRKISMSSPELIKNYVAKGFAMANIPKIALDPSIDEGVKILKIDGLKQIINMNIIMNKIGASSSCTNIFTDWIKRYFK